MGVKPTLNRSQLAQVFQEHDTLRAFEQALYDVGVTLPDDISNALSVAEQALIAAELSASSNASRTAVENLLKLVSQADPKPALQRQIDQIFNQLGLIEDQSALVRYILTRYATLNSPAFTGVPTAPTAAVDPFSPESGRRAAPKTREPRCGAVLRAHCRTRTGDPFLTIAVP